MCNTSLSKGQPESRHKVLLLDSSGLAQPPIGLLSPLITNRVQTEWFTEILKNQNTWLLRGDKRKWLYKDIVKNNNNTSQTIQV